MGHTGRSKATKKQTAPRVPLALTEELAGKVTAAATRLKLSQQDVMRLSIERGIPILEAQLTGAAA